jgi:hypothetical protein
MTEGLQWDWPPTKRYHKRRRARVEVLPPEQDEQEPRPQRVEIIFTRPRQQSTTNWPVLIRRHIGFLAFARQRLGAITRTGAVNLATRPSVLPPWNERRCGIKRRRLRPYLQDGIFSMISRARTRARSLKTRLARCGRTWDRRPLDDIQNNKKRRRFFIVGA